MEEKNSNEPKNYNLAGLMEHLISQQQNEEILERTVKIIGGSSHVLIPRKHLGKKVKILIPKQEVSDNQE